MGRGNGQGKCPGCGAVFDRMKWCSACGYNQVYEDEIESLRAELSGAQSSCEDIHRQWVHCQDELKQIKVEGNRREKN